jgi:PKD repeat protein
MRGEKTSVARWRMLWHVILRSGRSRPLLMGLACGGAVILGALVPLLNTSALACGLVNQPTMLANNQQATLLLKPGGTVDTPITGYFANVYVAGQPVSFVEDLTNMGLAPSFVAGLQWRWDFGDGGKANGITATHTFTNPGTYTVFSQVQSNGSWEDDFDSAYIKVIASAPVAAPVVVATSSAVVADPNTPITFDASASHAADGGQLTYSWNFADYTTSSDARVTHPFSAYLVSESPALTSVITLVVTDKKTGEQAVKYLDVEVVQQLPTVSIDTNTTNAGTGDNVTFAAVVTTPATPTPTGGTGAPPGGTIQPSTPTKYVWTFGDGTTKTTTAPTISRPYTKDGAFNVTLQVLDQHGFAYPSVGSVTISVAHDWTSQILLILGGLAVLVVGGALITAQIRRNRLIRERAAAMALARARAVQAGRDRRTLARQRAIRPDDYPRDPRYGPPPRDRRGP